MSFFQLWKDRMKLLFPTVNMGYVQPLRAKFNTFCIEFYTFLLLPLSTASRHLSLHPCWTVLASLYLSLLPFSTSTASGCLSLCPRWTRATTISLYTTVFLVSLITVTKSTPLLLASSSPSPPSLAPPALACWLLEFCICLGSSWLPRLLVSRRPILLL